MRAVKAKKLKNLVKDALQRSLDAGEGIMPYRKLSRGQHGNIVNDPRSFRGLYRALKKKNIKLEVRP